MSALVNSQNVTFAVGGSRAHFILYGGSPTVSDADIEEIRQAAHDREPLWIIYGSAGSSNYYAFTKSDSSGYYFKNINSDSSTVSTLLVTNSKSVITTRTPLTRPQTYFMGTSWWNSRISLTNQSSGTTLVQAPYGATDNVYLYANRKYLITTSCYGSIDWTTASNVDSEKRFSLHIVLTDSNYSLTYGKCISIGQAQFYFNNHKGSLNSGYHFIQSIHPVTTVITPTTNLTLNKFVWENNGNVVGGGSGSYAYADFDLGYVIVQEL